MGTKRLGVAVAVLDGYLYAIGGSDGQCPLNTGNVWQELKDFNLIINFLVERYDPKTNKWLSVAPMTTRRKHLGCAVYNGFICMFVAFLKLISY
jgi:kelch-like protein 20